jgi:hypothetical protein
MRYEHNVALRSQRKEDLRKNMERVRSIDKRKGDRHILPRGRIEKRVGGDRHIHRLKGDQF